MIEMIQTGANIPKKIILQKNIQTHIKKQVNKSFIIEMNDTEEKLCINLNPLYTESSLSCIKFNVYNKNESPYDQYIIQNTTFDTIEILIDGKQLFSVDYSNNNILPDQLLMLPINIAPFSKYTIALKYARNYKPVAHNISKYALLKMEISEIIFKKSFTNYNKQTINFDFNNVLFYTSGGYCSFFENKNKIIGNNHIALEEKVNQLYISAQNDIKYEPYQFDIYNGAIVQKHEKHDDNNCCGLMLLCLKDIKFDFGAEKFKIKLKEYSCEKNDTNEIYKFMLSRHSDVIIVEYMQFECSTEIQVIDIYVLIKNINDTLKIDTIFELQKNNNNYTVIFKEPLKINSVGAMYGIFLFTNVKNNSHNILLNNVAIGGKYLYFDTHIRNQFAKILKIK